MLKDTRCHKKSFYPIFFVKGSNFVQYPVSFIKLTQIFSEISSFIGYNCISLYTKIIHLWHKQLLLFITIWSSQKEKVWLIVKDEFLSQRKASQLLSHGAVPEISRLHVLSTLPICQYSLAIVGKKRWSLFRVQNWLFVRAGFRVAFA